MKQFAALFEALDTQTATNDKITALADYFARADPADAAWAVYLLCGHRLKRLLPTSVLREWTVEETGYPLWLVEATYASVGDLAETIALLLPEQPETQTYADVPLHLWMGEHLPTLRPLDDIERRTRVVGWWRAIPTPERFLLNKLLTGGFRVGVSQRLVVRGLAQYTGLSRERLAHRLTGQWQPGADFFHALVSARSQAVDAGRPYPFFLASPLQEDPDTLGAVEEWIVEWKWDGIRAQLLRRDGEIFLWSRGEEPLDGRFPEVEAAAEALPAGCVLDGEILAWADDAPLVFSQLQRRIGRKRPGKRILAEAPVVFHAFDLLEVGGADWREAALEQRLTTLAALLEGAPAALRANQPVVAASWGEYDRLRSQSRARRTEGFVLKRRGSTYQVGRTRGDWWKWKIAPHTIDAVLIYAEPGHGRRSNLLTDYTFGVWHDGELMPIARAYSGLAQAEIEQLDHWIRRHTSERFGPVRSVEIAHVFELACDSVQPSNRRKSGVALRFPRIHRWRHDLAPDAADSLAQVARLVDD